MEHKNKLNDILAMRDNIHTELPAGQSLSTFVTGDTHLHYTARQSFRNDIRKAIGMDLILPLKITITEMNHIVWNDNELREDPYQILQAVLETLRLWDVDIYNMNFYATRSHEDASNTDCYNTYIIHLQDFDS